MYAVEVIADRSGQWCGNGLKFPTSSEAKEYAIDLFHRWTLVENWRVVKIFPKGWDTTRVEVERKAP